jgi:hypothetical protein
MHLFDLYRRMLVLICTVYAVVRTIQGVGAIARRLRGEQPALRIARGYALALLATVKVHRFGWQLLQIIALAGALATLVYLHWRVLA